MQIGFNEAAVFFKPEQDNILLLAADVDWDSDSDPTIYGIVWVSVTEGQWKDPIGHFYITLIARAYKYRECGIGDRLLTQALRVCWDNHQFSGRPLEVAASIDYRNTASIRLFERHDFRQAGYNGGYIIYALPADSHEWERIGKTF